MQQRKRRSLCKASCVLGLSFVTLPSLATSQLSLIRYPAKLVPNYASQLNSPLKCSCSTVTSEKKRTLISLALILLYWFLPLYKLYLSLLEPMVSFCTATIKITGQWKALHPHPFGGGLWNNFQLCPRFLKGCFSALCCGDTSDWLLFCEEINLQMGPHSASFEVSK